MIESYDVGSLPVDGDAEVLRRGAAIYGSILHFLRGPEDADVQASRTFEERILRSFLDKVRAGVDVPNYPQFRDMNEMFLSSMEGLMKVGNRYVEVDKLSVQDEKARIPEVEAIRRNAARIADELGSPFRVKVCITGPHTLSCLFSYRHEELFLDLGEVLSRIVEENMFNMKHGRVAVLSLDEPTFGTFDDHLIDYGTEGRENLRKAWEEVFHKAKSAGVVTVIHLHSTSNELFWDVEALDVVESHVDDHLYKSKRTRRLLEEKDKFLKASVCRASFDSLIMTRLESQTEVKRTRTLPVEVEVGRVWRMIRRGELDPNVFLEDVDLMRKRLSKVIERFGRERVPYAGPECGLRGFPTYQSAVEYLRRVAEAVSSFK